jgi:hypothetical protein
MRCSIFCIDEKCRQPDGSSATRGIYGNAMIRPSLPRMPSLRCRLSGEPAITSDMWPMAAREQAGARV